MEDVGKGAVLGEVVVLLRHRRPRPARRYQRTSPPPTGPPARATQALPYSTYLWVRDDVEEAGSAVEMVAATATAGRVVAAIQPGPPAPATQERAPGAAG
eukprot:COSAG01_NODE_3604_length_5881_cov_6.368558_9_plen_100_part_00